MDKQNPTEQIRDVARQGAEQGMALSKQVLDAWTASTEATLKASFDLQNAVIESGRSLIGNTGETNKMLYQQWAAAVHRAQQATLEALNVSKQVSKEVSERVSAQVAPKPETK